MFEGFAIGADPERLREIVVNQTSSDKKPNTSLTRIDKGKLRRTPRC
jgi:hypothetical protein